VLSEKVLLYLDDMLIVSPTFLEHFDTLRKVSQCLTEAGLTMRLKKSHLCFKELRYLCFVIGRGILKTDPGKVEAIKNMSICLSKTLQKWQPH